MQFAGTPVIILGMGRSGTSYLASLVGSRGVDLGKNLIEPAAANPRGFFEDSEIIAFHQQVLRQLRPGPDSDQSDGPLLPPADLTAEEKEQAIRILERLATPNLWGWKDPRTVHFIHFWLDLLPQAKLIIPVRHPLEIQYSYLKQIASMEMLIDAKRIFRAYAENHERILRVVEERPERSLVLYAQNAFSNPAALSDIIDGFLGLPAAGPRQDLPVFESSEFTRLCIHRDAADIFAMLLPEAASAFEKLNRRAEFCFSPCPAPPELRAFSSQLAQSMKAAGTPFAPESWLPPLIDLCQPRGSSGFFSLQAELLSRHAETMRFQDAQVRGLRQELESHQALVKEQSAWIAQLEDARRFVVARDEACRKELEAYAALAGDQSAWIAHLEDAKRFFITQCEACRKELESQGTLVREQAAWIAQLEDAKRFFVAQCEACWKELESHAALVKEQAAWIAQLEDAKRYWAARNESSHEGLAPIGPAI